MTIQEIIDSLERLAPLDLQDSFDNAGLQIGLCDGKGFGINDSECTGVLVCLDVTEAVIDEAAVKGCNLIVSHHPLIFRPLRRVAGQTWQERCVVKAILNGIAIYSAHTNLDNAPDGVNYKIADILGLDNIQWLEEKPGAEAGSGIIGDMTSLMDEAQFISSLKEAFGVDCIAHSATKDRWVRKVAVCGGAGAFLLPKAVEMGADCFVCGEFSYHNYFDADGAYDGQGILLAELGHYQSEQFTMNLIRKWLLDNFFNLKVILTEINTNPIIFN